MTRTARFCPAGLAYHAMNRGIAGLTLFEEEGDYAAFEQVLVEAKERFPSMRLCAWCLMPNHFHLVLWPQQEGLLSRFMQWLSMTHTQRWHAFRGSGGRGHLYQSRFKSFPIAQDDHFLQVCRYVERNALRAGLPRGWSPETRRAEHWRWSSLAARNDPKRAAQLCDAWPLPRPRNWRALVNEAQTQAELEALRRCVVRGSPFGSEPWIEQTAASLGLESTTRPRGRPRQAAANGARGKGF